MSNFDTSNDYTYKLDVGSWYAWLSHRDKIERPLSMAASMMQVSFLCEHPIGEQRRIINRSIENNWKNIFPPKGFLKDPTVYLHNKPFLR